MKVVVINGSPRRDRAGFADARPCGRPVCPKGAKSRRCSFATCRSGPAPGCMKCRSLGRCILPGDDAHRAAEAIRGADALIVGSPCYWGNMSGALKVLLDRMVYAMMGERENGMADPAAQGQAGRAGRHVQYGLSVQRVVPPDDRRVPCLARDIEMERFPGCRDFGPGRMPQTRGADAPGNCEM